MAIERGADVIRTHDVAETADAAKIGAAFDEDSHRVEHDGLAVERIDVRSRREAARHIEAAGGDQELAGDARSALLAIEGLDPVARNRLRSAVEATGGAVTGDRRTLVIGSCREMSTLLEKVDALSQFEGILDSI
jgi:dihydropteroate synthase